MNRQSWNVMARVAGILLLAGCAGTNETSPTVRSAGGQATPLTPLCSGPEAQVTINQVSISGSTATIRVNPGSRSISPNAGGVRWKFSQNIYSFTSDGVTFKAGQPPGPASAPSTGDPTQFVWCFYDTASAPGSVWRYNIKFSANAAPATVWVCDPTIVNSGGGISADALMSVNCVPQ